MRVVVFKFNKNTTKEEFVKAWNNKRSSRAQYINE